MSAFGELEAKLSQRKGVTDPAGLAAAIGRKKYGPAQFQAMAKRGKKKKHPNALAMAAATKPVSKTKMGGL